MVSNAHRAVTSTQNAKKKIIDMNTIAVKYDAHSIAFQWCYMEMLCGNKNILDKPLLISHISV